MSKLRDYADMPMSQVGNCPDGGYFAPDSSGMVCKKVPHTFMHPQVAECIGLCAGDTLGVTPAGNFFAINNHSWVYQVTETEYEEFREDCKLAGTL